MNNEFWDANWKPQREISNPSLTLFLNGQKITQKLEEAKCKTIKDFIVLSEEIHAFTDDEHKDSWLKKNKQIQGNYEYVSKGVREIQETFKKLEQPKREEILERYVKHLLFQSEFVPSPHEQESENIKLPMFFAAGSWWPEGAYLYRHCDFGGYWIYLPFNSTFPALSLVFMNDAISSVILVRQSTPFSCNLFEHTWYRGRRVTIVADSPGTAKQVRCLKGYPYYFNDKASSVVVSNWWTS